jgi:DNA-binding NarL/FixJ family response regulator
MGYWSLGGGTVDFVCGAYGQPAQSWADKELAESMAHPKLSDRERRVLQYVANGQSNKEIGQVLYISENAVKAHVKSIPTKLDAMGRTAAIAIALPRGLIQSR